VTHGDTVTRGSLYLNYHLFLISTLTTLFINIFIERKEKKGGGAWFSRMPSGRAVFG
jgi:hypothetical protein